MAKTRARKVYGDPYGDHIKLMRDGSLRFVYHAGEVRFCFSLFCEVGAPYQLTMQRILDDNKLKLHPEAMNLDARPWYADRLEN